MIDKLRTDHQFNTEEFEVSCDGCDYSETYEVDFGWDELMQKMKDDGWVSKKFEGDWNNYCSDCSKKEK